MNSEELKTEFGLEFPTEIDGYKRPAEPLESGHDWFLEIPQLIAKDKVLYTGMNLILSALLSNEKLLKQWHDTLQNVVNAQDWRVVTDSLKGYMTPELKKKLDGIATGANNYVHPSTHPATMITQDATHRFVTDNEKNTWNAKASTAVVSTTANGLMPKRNGNASYIFTGDGVWKSLAWNLITGKPSTFPPSTHNHDSSYLKRDNNNKNDLNSCTVEGIYRFSGTLTGGWTGTSWGTLLVLNNQYNGGSGISGTYLVQLAFPTDNTIRMRQRVNTGAWSSWVTLARTSDNITSATKATQDSRGQQIDTTYVKGVTGSNATLTITKGNGTTSQVTINNVANATAASKVVQGTQYYLQSGNGDVDENTVISQNKANVVLGSWYSTGFRDLCSNGTPIKVAINHRNGNIKTLGSVTASGGFKGNADTASKLGTATIGSGVKPIYLNAGSPVASGSTVGSANRPIYMNGGTLSQCSIDLSTLAPKASPALTGSPTAPTQGTSDNSTKIATTAFVRNLINQFKTDGTLGGIVGGSLTQNGWAKFSNGLILQWGNNNGQGSFSRKVYSFPVAYSSAVYMMSANPKGNVGTGATKNAHSANVESLTQFSISVGEHNSMFWFSIGK